MFASNGCRFGLLAALCLQEPKTTFKYLCGIAMGCKIVTPEWLQEAARSGSASSSRHVVSKGRGTDRCCLAGLHFHLAGDSQWKATFSEVLKHAGAIPMPLPDDSKAQGESIIVVANPFQLVNQHNADLTARTARQLLHNGVQLVPGEWVLQALRTNAVPPLPPPPEGLEAAASRAKATLEAAARLNRAPGLPSHKEAEDAQECKPRESMDRKRKASAIAEEEETKRRPPAAGQAAPDNRRGPADAARDVWNGHHSGEGLSWVGETTEPPPELSHMRGHFRSFYNAFRSTALGCKALPSVNSSRCHGNLISPCFFPSLHRELCTMARPLIACAWATDLCRGLC